MPIINNLQDSNINEHPVRISKAEWLRKKATGEIDENNKMIYYITGDYTGKDGIVYTIGEGLLLDEDNEFYLSVDPDWIKNDVIPTIAIDAKTFNGYGISKNGKAGVVVIENDYNNLDFGDSITLNKNVSGTIKSSTISMNNDGIIYSEKLKANTAIKDDSNNEISDYIKNVTLNSFGSLVFTNGKGNTATLPILASGKNGIIRNGEGIYISQNQNGGVNISTNITTNASLKKDVTDDGQIILSTKFKDGKGIKTSYSNSGLEFNTNLTSGVGIQIVDSSKDPSITDNTLLKISPNLEAGDGISIDEYNGKLRIRNTGVISAPESTGVKKILTGVNKGKILVEYFQSSNKEEVAVQGLGSAAFLDVEESNNASSVAPIVLGKIPATYIPDLSSKYASTTHTHNNYALTSHTHDNYAAKNHTHSEYALTSHRHSAADIDGLPTSTGTSVSDATYDTKGILSVDFYSLLHIKNGKLSLYADQTTIKQTSEKIYVDTSKIIKTNGGLKSTSSTTSYGGELSVDLDNIIDGTTIVNNGGKLTAAVQSSSSGTSGISTIVGSGPISAITTNGKCTISIQPSDYSTLGVVMADNTTITVDEEGKGILSAVAPTVANSNNSNNLTSPRLRNIVFGTSTPTTSTLAKGDIYIKYE